MKSYRTWWADTNNKAVVYYQPITEAEAIRLNECQEPLESGEYQMLVDRIGVVEESREFDWWDTTLEDCYD